MEIVPRYYISPVPKNIHSLNSSALDCTAPRTQPLWPVDDDDIGLRGLPCSFSIVSEGGSRVQARRCNSPELRFIGRVATYPKSRQVARKLGVIAASTATCWKYRFRNLRTHIEDSAPTFCVLYAVSTIRSRLAFNNTPDKIYLLFS